MGAVLPIQSKVTPTDKVILAEELPKAFTAKIVYSWEEDTVVGVPDTTQVVALIVNPVGRVGEAVQEVGFPVTVGVIVVIATFLEKENWLVEKVMVGTAVAVEVPDEEPEVPDEESEVPVPFPTKPEAPDPASKLNNKLSESSEGSNACKMIGLR